MKIFTILTSLVLLSFNSPTIYAQRVIDLETVLVKPVQNATLTVGQSFEIEFFLRNNGPDAIVPGDTVAYQIQGLPGTFGNAFLTKNVNDTILVKKTLTISSASASVADVCITAIVKKGNLIADNNAINNNACHSVNFNGTNGVSDLVFSDDVQKRSIETFPNPSAGLVTFKYQTANNVAATVVVRNIAGQVVLKVDSLKLNVGTNSVSLNLSGLIDGVYFLEVIEPNSKGTGRLFIQNCR